MQHFESEQKLDEQAKQERKDFEIADDKRRKTLDDAAEAAKKAVVVAEGLAAKAHETADAAKEKLDKADKESDEHKTLEAEYEQLVVVAKAADDALEAKELAKNTANSMRMKKRRHSLDNTHGGEAFSFDCGWKGHVHLSIKKALWERNHRMMRFQNPKKGGKWENLSWCRTRTGWHIPFSSMK